MNIMENTMTETERDNQWHQDHPGCETCNKPVAVVGKDGLELSCTGCLMDHGTAVADEHGVIGYVHDGECRFRYETEIAVEMVYTALRVRLPLGMQPWAAERSRNVVSVLLAEFDIKLKEAK
jgi:hypothetical protein